MLGLGVATVCGYDTVGATDAIADALDGFDDAVAAATAALPTDAPTAISVLTLPELRGAGDFFMLKFIEATGLAVRTVPLEESGHVDYFIGPQAHLSLLLVGDAGRDRFDRLQLALEHTGQTVQQLRLMGAGESGKRNALTAELSGAVFGSLLAGEAAERWGRPPFRGGAVNMDASHIKLDGVPVAAE